MQSWLTVWNHADKMLLGFGTTVLIFILSSVISFVFACLLAYLLDGEQNFARRGLRGILDLIRTSPFLIYVYLLYYGLPEAGIRLDAMTAGMVALVTYHGCYFAEILRGARLALPQGQAESARSHGYTPLAMFRRILLPQMIYRSGPLFGNQFICILKDTAFLSIITVFELTAAANDVQAVYFVPMPAFITAIAFYWLVSLGIEASMRLLGRFAKTRGLSYE